ncbi:hypothetical protein ACFZAE_40915 [Streptomyces scabiei]|uniref:hypothetical protein n=2 Tax=Streptomyces TaxID=1883 RepID=UPI0036E8EE39
MLRAIDRAPKRERTTMRISRPLSVVIVACAAVTLGAAAAPAADSSGRHTVRETAEAKAAPAAGLLGIGWRVTPHTDTAMFSGPGLSTPRIGTAWLGDNVAAICKITDNRGNRMVLGIERPGRNGVQWANTVGYMWGTDLRDIDINILPSCDGYGRGVHPRIETGMYSAPGLSTPRIGTAWTGDDVAGICKINDNRGNRMVLGIERPGRAGVQWANTAGYIWDGDIRENTDSLPDCGTE